MADPAAAAEQRAGSSSVGALLREISDALRNSPVEDPAGEARDIVAAVLDEAEVLNLAVSPSCRGLGVGGMLLDAALSEAAAAGATSVFLEVRESNVAARALYASRGFTEISRRSRYYRKPVEDALVLRGAVQ